MPRLTLLRQNEDLMVTLASSVHEGPIAPFVKALDSVTEKIGHDPDVVRIRVDTNTSCNGDKVSGEPDILLQISGRSFRQELFTRRKLLCIECAFSQKDEDLMAKLKAFICDMPELIVVGRSPSPKRTPSRLLRIAHT